MSPRISITRSLVVRHAGLVVKVPIGNCFWCTDTALCGAHGAMADRVRTNLVKTAAKRAARKAAAR